MNCRKYIQLTINNQKIHLTTYVTQCFGSRKTADVSCSISRISTLFTFAQSVSECLCRAYNMNEVTQSVCFSHPCMLKPMLDSLMANELV